MLLLATLFANTAWAYDDLQLLNGYSLTAYADKSYSISSVADWNALAAYVAANKNNHCEGLTFKMTTSIGTANEPVTTMMGSSKNNRFAGTFDGGGKTLTVSLTSIETSPNYCAPFAYTRKATIKNLHVAGTITTTGQFAAGLVGQTGPDNDQDRGQCTITNCQVSVEIVSNYVQQNNKYANHGGFIGIAEGNAYITNSWFDGKFSGRDYKYSAGFIGLNKGKMEITTEAGNETGTKLKYCLFNPQSLGNLDTTGSCEFIHDSNGGTHTLTNCYWVTHFGEPEKAQGQKVIASLSEAFYSHESNMDHYVTTVTDAPDGKPYYIVKYHPTWEDVQTYLEAGREFFLPVHLEAGSLDQAIVIPSGVTATLTMKVPVEDSGSEETPVDDSEESFDYGILDRCLIYGDAKDNGYVIKVEEGATLIINGGTISGGNNTTDGGGIYNDGTLILNGTAITGNASVGNGAGIYNNGTLTIDGATITSNQSNNTSSRGIGVYVTSTSTFEAKGKVQINENYCKTYNTSSVVSLKPHNVYLDGDKILTIIGKGLTEGSAINIDRAKNDIIATFLPSEVENESLFTSIFKKDDDKNKIVYIDNSYLVRFYKPGKKPLTSKDIRVEFPESNPIYSGLEITPNVTVWDEPEDTEPINITERCNIVPSNNVVVGTAKVTITLKNSNDADYIGYTTATFTIAPKPITITANAQTVTYGSSFSGGTTTDVTVTNPDGSTEGALVNGHSLTAITLTASEGADVETSGTITPTAAVIKDGTTDMTGNYDITYKTGTLTMTPKPITIKAIDQTVTYSETIQQGTDYVIISNTKTEDETEDNTEDNTDISTENTTENPLVGNQKLTAITLTASEGADVETPGTITPSAATIKDGETDMTKYYDITYETGTLTVSPLSGVVVTITGNHNGYEFDNQEHSVSGYKVEISNSLYTEADFTFSGNAEAKRTETGTTYMGLKADLFKNENNNFNVTFNVTDGFMNITYHIASFADNADNTTIIRNIVLARAGMSDVILAGRTLYKDGHWNTICLPFAVTIAGSPLAGADVRELSSASFADGVLDLEFTEEGSVTALEAGVPYIIKWAEGTNIFEPRFDGVTLSNEPKDKTFDLGDGKSITFKGTYAPVVFEENKSILLVGEGSTLYYPLAGAYTNAQHAYFQLEGIEVGAMQSNVIGFRFGDATGIPNLNDLKDLKDLNVLNAIYYDLSGRRINGQPTEAGIYIVNGKKVVIK